MIGDHEFLTWLIYKKKKGKMEKIAKQIISWLICEIIPEQKRSFSGWMLCLIS